MQESRLEHETNDRVILRGHIWSPEDADNARGVVHVVHGMSEHGGRYKRLAESLTNEGYIVYAPDTRGHGLTAGDPKHLGHLADMDGWALVVSDVLELNHLIHKRHPGLPIALLGHSMGSFISQHYITLYGQTVQAVALSATDFSSGQLRRIARVLAYWEKSRRGVEHRSRLMNALSFGSFNKPFKPNRTDFDWLSRDDAEVDKYIKDPMCGFLCSAQTWEDMFIGLERIHSQHTRQRIPKELPIYLLSGDKDPVGKFGRGPTRLHAAYQKAGIRDVTLKLYNCVRHEPFNEINRNEITADLVEWLHAHL